MINYFSQVGTFIILSVNNFWKINAQSYTLQLTFKNYYDYLLSFTVIQGILIIICKVC